MHLCVSDCWAVVKLFLSGAKICWALWMYVCSMHLHVCLLWETHCELNWLSGRFAALCEFFQDMVHVRCAREVYIWISCINAKRHRCFLTSMSRDSLSNGNDAMLTRTPIRAHFPSVYIENFLLNFNSPCVQLYAKCFWSRFFWANQTLMRTQWQRENNNNKVIN